MKRRRGIMYYSEIIPGTEGNFDCDARFDIIDGFVGITSFDGHSEKVKDRILLNKKQFKALVKFVEEG